MKNFTKNSYLLNQEQTCFSPSFGVKAKSVNSVKYFFRQRNKKSSFSNLLSNRLTAAFILISLSIVASAQTTSWKGVNSTWTNTANWTNGVPTAAMDVIIGDANFTGASNPSSLSSTAVFNSITIGGTKTASITFGSSRTVNNIFINANGTLTLNKINLTILGDFTNNGSYVSTVSTNREFMAGFTQNISGTSTTTFKALTIEAGTEVTFSTNFTSPLTLLGTLIPSNVTHPKKSGTTTIKAGGVLKVNASVYSDNYGSNPTIDNGGIVEYSGIINQTIESSIGYKNLYISGSGVKTPEGTFTLSSIAPGEGNVDVISGTLDLATYTMNRASTNGGTFFVEDGAILKIGGTGTFPINYTTRTLDPTSTVEYSGTAQTVTNLPYGHLVFSSSSGAAVKTFAAGALTIAGDFTSNKGVGTSVAYTAVAAINFNGSVTIGASTTFTAGAFTHTVAKNWTNTGTFTNTNSTIEFNGTLTQTVTSTGAFNKIVVNKATNKLNLASDLTVNSTLTFTKGQVVTTTFKVILPNGGSIVGAGSTTGWVNGYLQKYFSAVGGGSFEIGGPTSYTPITVSFAAITTAGSLIANATPSSHPNVNSSTIVYRNIARYWTLAKPATGGITFTTASITFNWNTSDNYSPLTPSLLKVGNYFSSSWTYPSITGTPTTTSLSISGVPNTVGAFAVGENNPCTISSGFSYGSLDYCAGSGTASIILNAGATAGTFTASPSGLIINASTGLITLTGSAPNTYTITNTTTSGSCTSTSSFTIDINPVPSASLSYPSTTYCQTSGIVPATITGTTGGTFSSTTGLTLNITSGAVTPATSKPGVYIVTYTIAAADGCGSFTTTRSITITAAPKATISYDRSPYCLFGGTANPTINGSTGGTFSSTIGLVINNTTGNINLTSSLAGTYTVTYLLAAGNGCTSVTTSTIVTITTAVATTLSYVGSPFCNQGTASPTLVGTSGGSYTSTAGLDIDETTGVINLATSTPGTYVVTYAVFPDLGCSVLITTSVTVKAGPSAAIAYSSSSFCKDFGSVLVTQTGTTGGIYSSSAGLSINSISGTISTTLSLVGTYTVNYTVSNNGCTITTSTSVSIIATPSATITYIGAPFCTSGTASVTLVGTGGGTYSSTTGLSLNATTGALNLAASSAGKYTVTYTVTSGGCPFSTTTSVLVGPIGTWSGAVSSDWVNILNWVCNEIPTSADNLTILSGLPNYPRISGVQSNQVKDISIASGASLIVDNAILKIAGNINNSGSFSAINAAVIEFNGTSAQSIPANTFAGNIIPSLNAKNVAGVTLNGPLSITDIFSPFTGTFHTNGFLTLKSTVDNTARVDQIPSANLNPIVGDVTVERYIPGRRKYRLIGPSVTTSSMAVLPVGQEARSIWGNWQNAGDNSKQNIGTYVTGGTAADGFDQQTTNASIFTYNETTKRFVGVTSASGKNTKYTPLVAGQAYYMFVYGDRQNTVSTSNPRPTVLKATGTLAFGPQTFNTTSAIKLTGTIGNYTLLGNPYACTIDWKSVQKAGVSTTTWGWDANLNNTGGYVTVTATAGGATVSPLSSLVKVSRYIQPGQGFFVMTTATNPQIVINEMNKLNNFSLINNTVFRTAGTQEVEPAVIAINLLYSNAGVTYLADGAVASFDSTFSKNIGEEDGVKMSNTTESVSLAEGANLLSINGTNNPVADDTLKINIARLSKANYTLEVFTSNFKKYDLIPYLQDTYLNTEKVLSLTDTNRIAFTVTSTIPASADANRFSIVWKPSSTLPVTFSSIAATVKNKSVVVDWKVLHESSMKAYEVQRSGNATDYTTIGSVPAKNANSTNYTLVDDQPKAGNNYYRVKGLQQDGKITYTHVALAKIELAITEDIQIYPNPIKEKDIFLNLKGISIGQLRVSLSNAQGQVMYKNKIVYNGTSYLKVSLEDKLPSGIYYLKVETNQKVISKMILVDN